MLLFEFILPGSASRMRQCSAAAIERSMADSSLCSSLRRSRRRRLDRGLLNVTNTVARSVKF